MTRYTHSRSAFVLRPVIYQQGMTLIELMVGITIGLLTIAVAMGALMISRGVSGTVSESSQMQQQAAYAFRVLGQQLRQAGSVRLNLAANKGATETVLFDDVVAFETIFDRKINTITGKDNPAAGEYSLTTGYQNYKEETVKTAAGESLFRDCLAQQPSDTIITNQFVIKNGNELHCAGSDNTSQAIIKNVADFRIQYLIQTDALIGAPKIRVVNATTAAGDWTQVFGVSVCLDLVGTEIINTAGTNYTKCDGTSVTRGNRLHMIFRNVYQLRSQGSTG